MAGFVQYSKAMGASITSFFHCHNDHEPQAMLKLYPLLKIMLTPVQVDCSWMQVFQQLSALVPVIYQICTS